MRVGNDDIQSRAVTVVGQSRGKVYQVIALAVGQVAVGRRRTGVAQSRVGIRGGRHPFYNTQVGLTHDDAGAIGIVICTVNSPLCAVAELSAFGIGSDVGDFDFVHNDNFIGNGIVVVAVGDVADGNIKVRIAADIGRRDCRKTACQIGGYSG